MLFLFEDCSTESYTKSDGSKAWSIFLSEKLEHQKAVQVCKLLGAELLSFADDHEKETFQSNEV